MKNFTRIVRCMLYTVLMMVWGCVAEPELENADNAENGIPATRAQSDGKYYYAFDEKVPLYEVADRMVVTFDKENRSNLEERLVHGGQILNDKLHILDGYYSDYSVITLRDSSDKKVFRDDLSKQAGIKSVRQVYAIEDGYEMGYTNEVIMQFKKSASQKEIDEMHKKFNTEVIKTSKLYMLLSIPVEFDPLDVANAYQESGLTNYSYPNFITSAVSYQTLPTDPYFNNQFYLYNTGQGVNGRTSTAGADINAVNAWSITKGSPNIVVAVIDYNGFTPNHPDMPNMLTGRNFGVGGTNNYFATGNNNHGNACSGIIGAAHNNGQGIAGIAPNCKILPIKISSTDATYWADAIEFAADNADIISCSCGIPDSRGYESTNPNLHPVVVDAIRYATTSGRRGVKGSVLAFAPSNSANHILGNNGKIYFPSNVNITGVLTVGAIDRNGQQSNYSPTSDPGSSHNQIIDVVAPSHRAYSSQISTETFDVWTIDIPDAVGDNPTYYDPYDPTDAYYYYGSGVYLPASGTNYQAYTSLFGGTSAAAPQVAGIATLMLSVSPGLTSQEVHGIIQRTASNNRVWNSQTGYGLVDAGAALMETLDDGMRGMHIRGPEEVASYTNNTYTLESSPLLSTYFNTYFNGWSVSPAGAWATLTDMGRTVIASFGGLSPITLNATFTMPSTGLTHTVSKTVRVHNFSVPIIDWVHEDLPGTNGWDAKVWVINPQTDVDYEWRINNSGSVYSWPAQPTWIYLSQENIGYSDRYIVSCRALWKGSHIAKSDWSNTLVIMAP